MMAGELTKEQSISSSSDNDEAFQGPSISFTGQASVEVPEASSASTSKSDKNIEVSRIVMLGRDKRTPQQHMKLCSWLATRTSLGRLPSSTLHAVAHHSSGVELYPGLSLYKSGDAADAFYVVVDGSIHLMDDKEHDDGSPGGHGTIMRVLTCGDQFGEEEILAAAAATGHASTRRPFSTVAAEPSTVIKLNHKIYKKLLADVHTPVFDAKVAFLSRLAPLKQLKEATVRSLAPCFQMVDIHKGDFVVRQGEKADAMYAIWSGTCSVLVDPHHKADSEGLAEVDPKKVVKVVTLEQGAIIGDITVLAKMKRRTASVVATSEVVCLKIKRGMFLKHLPQDQLEVLHRLAADKMKLMEKKVATQPVQRDQPGQEYLHGHNLRQLMMHQAQQRQGQPSQEQEEYQQLIYLLRKYKRCDTRQYSIPRGIPGAFMMDKQPTEANVSVTTVEHRGHFSPPYGRVTLGTSTFTGAGDPLVSGAETNATANAAHGGSHVATHGRRGGVGRRATIGSPYVSVTTPAGNLGGTWSGPSSPSLMPLTLQERPVDISGFDTLTSCNSGWMPLNTEQAYVCDHSKIATSHVSGGGLGNTTGDGGAAGRAGSWLQLSKSMTSPTQKRWRPTSPSLHRIPRVSLGDGNTVSPTACQSMICSTSPFPIRNIATAKDEDGDSNNHYSVKTEGDRCDEQQDSQTSSTPQVAAQRFEHHHQHHGNVLPELPGSPSGSAAVSPRALTLKQQTAVAGTDGCHTFPKLPQSPTAAGSTAGRLTQHVQHTPQHKVTVRNVPVSNFHNNSNQSIQAALDALALPLMQSQAPQHLLRKGAAHFRPAIPKAML